MTNIWVIWLAVHFPEIGKPIIQSPNYGMYQVPVLLGLVSLAQLLDQRFFFLCQWHVCTMYNQSFNWLINRIDRCHNDEHRTKSPKQKKTSLFWHQTLMLSDHPALSDAVHTADNVRLRLCVACHGVKCSFLHVNIHRRNFGTPCLRRVSIYVSNCTISYFPCSVCYRYCTFGCLMF